MGTNDKNQPSTHIRKPEVSHTPGFKEAARYLSAYIDTSVDPCDDFYKYTCGGFLKNNLTNAFAVVQREDDDVLIEELGKVDVEVCWNFFVILYLRSFMYNIAGSQSAATGSMGIRCMYECKFDKVCG